jgi:hypothetical protein
MTEFEGIEIKTYPEAFGCLVGCAESLESSIRLARDNDAEVKAALERFFERLVWIRKTLERNR